MPENLPINARNPDPIANMSATEPNPSTQNSSIPVTAPPTTAKMTPSEPQTPLSPAPNSFFPTQPLSGHGTAKQSGLQPHSASNRSVYPPRPVIAYCRRPVGSNHLDPKGNLIRPVHPQEQPMSNQIPHSGSVKGITVSPQAKAAPHLPSICGGNGHKLTRDDTFAIVRDRKVRISAEASLYSLCRSWLRNGIHEESQPLKSECAKPLPRPLPAHEVDAATLAEDGNEEQNNETDEEENSVEHLTAKNLLQRHIKRAKRIRARIRENRLKRITRYRSRLALLLPPCVEQC